MFFPVFCQLLGKTRSWSNLGLGIPGVFTSDIAVWAALCDEPPDATRQTVFPHLHHYGNWISCVSTWTQKCTFPDVGGLFLSPALAGKFCMNLSQISLLSPSPISWVTCGFSDSHPLASLPHLQSYDLDRSLPTLIQLCLQPDFGWQETIKAPAITIPIHPHGPYFILICLSAFSTQG